MFPGIIKGCGVRRRQGDSQRRPSNVNSVVGGEREVLCFLTNKHLSERSDQTNAEEGGGCWLGVG